MKHRWILRPIDAGDSVRQLSRQLNDLPLPLARALAVRGITSFEEARTFFRPSADQLLDPFLMRDMEPAAERLAQAIRNRERVLVYGDYDVDGTTSAALMTSFLRDQGVDAQYFIPHRFRDGYGLSNTGIDHALAIGATLIVTLDCGITGHEPAAYARSKDIDLIICDHHTAADTLPDALAVLDPKRPDCPYPFKDLSGCGVGFKLVQATLERMGRPREASYAYLDLVSLSIASDIVPVLGENRVLMIKGLNRIREHPRLGLRKLAEVINRVPGKSSSLDLKACCTSQIVFKIGPRLNAAGRLDEARLATDLLTATDERHAAQLAESLEKLNGQRRDLDRKTYHEALALVETSASTCLEDALVLHGPDWHLGVIGIVASRLVERFYKPTVMLASHNGEVKGSARSITGLNVYDALKDCAPLLTQFGGHMYAAGLTLPEANVDSFRERFRRAVRERSTPDILTPEIPVDAPLRLDEITPRFWSVLRQFAPFGPENKSPIFFSRDLRVVGSPSIVGDGHLKFRVGARNGTTREIYDVIGFNMHQHLPTVRAGKENPNGLQMVYAIEENTYRGRTALQFKLKGVCLQDTPAIQQPASAEASLEQAMRE